MSYIWEMITDNLAVKLKEFAGEKILVVGVSGGIDSAVVACLATRAVGASKVLALWLPYGNPNKGFDGAQEIACKWLGLKLEIVNITDAVNSISSQTCAVDVLSKGNIMARQRMVSLYAYANAIGGLVVGTGNATEIAIGYGTKYGDEGVDVQPIGSLLKCEVKAIAKTMKGMPEWVINQAPSAGLWEGQTDEGELGMSYDDIDKVLEGYGNLVKKPLRDKVEAMQKSSWHKRVTPPILTIEDSLGMTLKDHMDLISARKQLLGIKLLEIP